MNVTSSEFNCLPVFSYTKNKIIYNEGDKLFLVDNDRNIIKILTISDQLNYTEQFNPISPNGEYIFLNHFIYSFKDTSLKLIQRDSLVRDFKWSSDTTLILSEWNSTTGETFLVEYSINSARKDTFYWFNPDMRGNVWDYDIKRNKVYYSTLKMISGVGGVTELHVYDRAKTNDSILFQYPKDKDPGCFSYYPGGEISQIRWLGNYEKMSFLFNYLLDGFATDIYTYWPDSNKITKVTNGCMHYGVKHSFEWVNDDSLAYSDISQYQMYGISVNNITSVKNEVLTAIPANYSLRQNFPNPFNPSTTINYSLPHSGNVKLTVYNSIGSKVATLVNEYKTAGNYSVQFNGSNLASGIYLYRLESGSYSAVKKFIILK
jgi:hypothetical protein